MKNIIILTICLFPLLSTAQTFKPLEKVFEVKEHDLIPEGIAYDTENDAFYIGSLYKNKVIKIDSNGTVTDFISSNKYGSWGYVGMKVKDGMLWVCKNPMSNKVDSAGFSGLFAYDLKSGKQTQKYITSEGGHFFNDIAFHNDNIYITDSNAGAVYRVDSSKDSLEVFIPSGSFIFPNGITISPDSTGIIIATSRGLQNINFETKEFSMIPHPGYYIVGIDGLYTYQGTLIGLQNVIKPESINQFILNENLNEVEAINTLSCAHPAFYQPTTGAIKDGWLYFIANSYVTTLSPEKTLTKEQALKNLEIYRVKLD